MLLIYPLGSHIIINICMYIQVGVLVILTQYALLFSYKVVYKFPPFLYTVVFKYVFCMKGLLYCNIYYKVKGRLKYTVAQISPW